MKYYYLTNEDGTTYNGFNPFANGDIAYAPDWVDDDREFGAALHVVAEDPVLALDHVDRNKPIANEVEPIDSKPQRGGKIRCRGVKRIRQLSVVEFAAFFEKHGVGGATMAAENGHLDVLEWLEKKGIFPNVYEANLAAKNGHLEVLRWAFKKRKILPSVYGANWAAGNGQLEVLQWLEKQDILPDIHGANGAAENEHLDVLEWLSNHGTFPNIKLYHKHYYKNIRRFYE